MKRSLYLFPLMAFTASTLILAGCDDNTADDQAAANGTAMTAPAGEQVAPSTMPAATDTTTGTTAPGMAGMDAAVNAEGATAYATAEGTTNGVLFLTLHNPGAQPDRLIGASADVASTVEIHETYVGADGTMQMRRVDAVEVPPGQQINLSPDGYHIMLMGLSQPLVEGQTFNVTLDFDQADDVTLPVTIVAPGSDASAGSTTTMNQTGTGMTGTGMGTTGTGTTGMDTTGMGSDAGTATTLPTDDTMGTTGGTGTTTGTGSMDDTTGTVDDSSGMTGTGTTGTGTTGTGSTVDGQTAQ